MKLSTLFPRSVVTLEATPEMWEGRLYPREEECVRNAVEKRRREFTAGRMCARRALALLGVEDFPLLMAPDRSPVWPPDIVGSLTHCDDYCAVVVARRHPIESIGLDVERAGPLDANIVRLVCTPSERAWMEKLEEEQSRRPRTGSLGKEPHATERLAMGQLAKIIFSAKECTYKCLYPLTRTMLDFHDVEIALDLRGGTFSARVRESAIALEGAADREGAGKRDRETKREPETGRAATFEGTPLSAIPPILPGSYALDDTRVYCGMTLAAPVEVRS